MRYVVLLLLAGCSLDSSAIGSKPPKRDISKLLDAGGIGVIVFDADADAAPELEDGGPEDSGAAGSGPDDDDDDAAMDAAEDAEGVADPQDASEPKDADMPAPDTGTEPELAELCESCEQDSDCLPRHICIGLSASIPVRCYPLKDLPSDPPCSDWGSGVQTIHYDAIDHTLCKPADCDQWIRP